MSESEDKDLESRIDTMGTPNDSRTAPTAIVTRTVNPYDVLNPAREKPLNPWQPESNPITLAVLGKLAEELAEASGIVARCQIQGVGEREPVTLVQNREALQNELADVMATTEMAIKRFGLDVVAMRVRADRKIEHLTRWHQLIDRRGHE